MSSLVKIIIKYLRWIVTMLVIFFAQFHSIFTIISIRNDNIASNDGRWSFVAAILHRETRQPLCVGTILNDNSILTSAQCFTKTLSNYQYGDLDLDSAAEKLIAYIGHTDIRTLNRDYLYDIDKVIPGPRFDPRRIGSADIGVVKLRPAIPDSMFASGRIRRVCLPRNGGDDDDYYRAGISEISKIENRNSDCIAAGWGARNSTEIWSDDLRIAQPIVIANFSLCLEQFRPFLSANFTRNFSENTLICADTRSVAADTCHGDTGGPLLCPLRGKKFRNDLNSKFDFHQSDLTRNVSNGYGSSTSVGEDREILYAQLGLASFGIGCGRHVAAYTRLSSYADWIQGIAEST